MFVHDGERLLVPPSLQGAVVQNTARSCLTVLTEVLRFKKKEKEKSVFWCPQSRELQFVLAESFLTEFDGVYLPYIFSLEKGEIMLLLQIAAT